MDLIDQLVGDLRQESCVFCRVEVKEPWRIQKTKSPVAPFYVVLSGAVRVTCGADEYELVGGDFLVLTRGDAHEVMGLNSQKAESVPLLSLFARAGIEPWKPGMRYRAVRIAYGGEGCEAVFLIGLFHFGEPGKNPLLTALPNVLVIRDSKYPSSIIGGTIQNIVSELERDQPGSSLVIAKHADLLFVQALREYLQTNLQPTAGWIRGMADPYVGKALALMHASPDQPWTIQSLAEATGCSRAVLARRFNSLMAEGAMTYLTRWRMNVAANLLLRGEANVSTIAFKIGYRPDAFANAFRRWAGVSPRDYRHTKRENSTSDS